MTDRRQGEIKPYSYPWYEALPHAVTDMVYGPNANAQQGAWIKKLVGPENPLNLPGQFSEGLHNAQQGYQTGNAAGAIGGAAQAVMAAIPAASPFSRALAAALRRMPDNTLGSMGGKMSYPRQSELHLPGEMAPRLPMELPAAPAPRHVPLEPPSNGSSSQQMEMPFPGKQETLPLDSRRDIPVVPSTEGVARLRSQNLSKAQEAAERLQGVLPADATYFYDANTPNGSVYLSVRVPGTRPLEIRFADHAGLDKHLNRLSVDPATGNGIDEVIAIARGHFGMASEPVEIGWASLRRHAEGERSKTQRGGRALYDPARPIAKRVSRTNELFAPAGIAAATAAMHDPYTDELRRQLAGE